MISSGSTVRLSIVGATGQMGRAIARCALEHANIRITGAVASRDSTALGRDFGDVAGLPPLGVAITSDLPQALADADVVVDFSKATATRSVLSACRAARKPLLLGTTGLPIDLESDFDTTARDIALLVAPNTSVGATLLMELVGTTAALLSRDFDIEIIEAHGRGMTVAPSGTALALARSVAAARGQDGEQVMVTTRRAGRRKEGTIGISSVRAVGIAGEHAVLFSADCEQILLSHRVSDYDLFARGAFQGARWLIGQPPGRYRMRDAILEALWAQGGARDRGS